MKELYTIFMFIIVSISLLVGTVFYHENAHQQISYSYGCEDSVIKYNIISSHETCKKWSVNTTSESIRDMMYLQSLNEIESYNNMMIMLAILCAGMFVALRDGEKENGRN